MTTNGKDIHWHAEEPLVGQWMAAPGKLDATAGQSHCLLSLFHIRVPLGIQIVRSREVTQWGHDADDLYPPCRA